MAKKRDPKVGTGKKPRDLVGDYIQMRILKILSVLNLQLLQMPVRLWQKLKKLINPSHEKSKFLPLVSKEPKLWVRQRWQAYLKKVRKR